LGDVGDIEKEPTTNGKNTITDFEMVRNYRDLKRGAK
jgi:hypothetical protein